MATNNKTSVTTLSGSAALTADTTGTDPVSIYESSGGYVGFSVTGTFGAGTLKIQGSLEDSGGIWFDIPSASWTAEGYKHLQVFARRLRCVLTGATAPSLTVKMAGVNPGLTVTAS